MGNWSGGSANLLLRHEHSKSDSGSYYPGGWCTDGRIEGIAESILVRWVLRLSTMCPSISSSTAVVLGTRSTSMYLMLYGPSTSNLSHLSHCCSMPPSSPILGNVVDMTPQVLECRMRQGEDVPLDHVHHAPEDKSVSRQHRLDPNTSVEGTHGPVDETFAQSRTAVVRCKKGCSYLAQMVVTQYYHLRPCVGRWRQQLGDDCGRYGQLLHKLSCHHDL